MQNELLQSQSIIKLFKRGPFYLAQVNDDMEENCGILSLVQLAFMFSHFNCIISLEFPHSTFGPASLINSLDDCKILL